MLCLEGFVSERLEFGTVDGAFEELNKRLPVASTVLTEGHSELLL